MILTCLVKFEKVLVAAVASPRIFLDAILVAKADVDSIVAGLGVDEEGKKISKMN